ncbi:type II secretion system F family protein, partial [Candidatus Kuenenbacteria bacterium]|nr:type II secretion system F family protein [Candidatus Kuenenbacteria bacterium]
INKKKQKKKNIIGWVTQKEILFFTKNLSIMLRSGSTLSEALKILHDQSKAKLEVILSDVIQMTQKGVELSQALSKHKKTFSELYVNIVKIGEESGTLEKNLEYLADQLEKSYRLRKKILGAMLYPAIIIIGILLLGFGITFFILPKISNMFKNFRVELPWSTKILIFISDFFQNYGLWAILGGIAIVIFLSWFLRTKFVKPFTHKVILILPICKSISKNFNLSMFYRSLSILLKSGVTIDEGIKICTKTISNVHYKNFLLETYQKIKGGETLCKALKEKPKLFPPTDTQIISVGEKSGGLPESLSYGASIHEDQLDDISQNLSSILEPVLFIFLGIIVAILALSIISPIYSITQQFQR